MFHIPLGDDGHVVSLFVLILSCAVEGILILLITVLSGDYLIAKQKVVSSDHMSS